MENDLYFGLYLCVNGGCEMKVNDRLCKINAGDALVKSPLVQINKLKEYGNFEVVAIFEEDMEVLAPIAEKNIEVVQEFVRQNKFYSTCNEQEQLILLRNKQHIDEYKQELSKIDISAKQYQVIKNIIMLMEQAMNPAIAAEDCGRTQPIITIGCAKIHGSMRGCYSGGMLCIILPITLPEITEMKIVC